MSSPRTDLRCLRWVRFPTRRAGVLEFLVLLAIAVAVYGLFEMAKALL